MRLIAVGIVLVLAGTVQAIEFVRTKANNGNLVMEDVPRVPQSVIGDLNQFQNVRSASFLDWAEDGQSIYVSTRFAETNQVHRVDMPLGTRRQLTFFNEPVGAVMRRPGHQNLLFMRDANGAEFSQLFTLDPRSGATELLTDGRSRNDEAVWDRAGRNIAYQSTTRNGASNDVWLMDPDDPGNTRMVLESPDGTWWGPQEFTESGNKVLVRNYLSVADSRVHLLNLDSGEYPLLAGGGASTSSNIPIGFDENDEGYWLISNQSGEFDQLAWQPLTPGAPLQYVTEDIPWDVIDGAISHDRRRLAFIANENGLSRLYLMDTRSQEYRAVDSLPTGLIHRMAFSPDDSRIALSLNSARMPSDTFVLDLGGTPLEYGRLTRWTESEVGGLDTSDFILPELIRFPTFDKTDGAKRQIPAWLYMPTGPGPHPVIISIHGGPESQARPFFSSTYQMWLAKLGVAIVVPNVRGSSGYGKSYLALDNGFKREDSVKDIGALLKWIDSNPNLDESRVGVYGGSYGGYMALASAVNYSDKLKAAVDVVGISNFVTFLENTQDYRRDLRRQEYGDERDARMRRHLEKISPVNNVRKIDIPMFIVQGQNDPRVPVTESEQMVEALRQQGLPVWYMNAMNEGHGYRKKENRDIYQQAMVLFFRQYLVGDE
jgi:dipeptidyl aminopeptidase/acylaminoacyl peptidase